MDMTPAGRAPSVLVLRFSAAGDIVLTHGAVAALARAWPHRRIVYVTHERFAGLMGANPHVDRVVALRPKEGFSGFVKRLRAENPVAILDLHNKARTRLLRWLFAGTPTQVWRKRPWQTTLAVQYGGARYRAGQRITQRYHAAVEALVGHPLPEHPLRYHITPEDAAAGLALLRYRGLRPSAPIVGVSPGAMWETKRWPVENFAGLVQRLCQASVQVVLTGSAAERDLHEHIRLQAPQAISLAGACDLSTLGGVLSHLQAFVANDSGPMHMARGLGIPTLAIFGSTDPEQFDFSQHQVLFSQRECAPCSFHGLNRCPRGHLKCLSDLTVEQAWHALLPLLHSGTRPLVALG